MRIFWTRTEYHPWSYYLNNTCLKIQVKSVKFCYSDCHTLDKKLRLEFIYDVYAAIQIKKSSRNAKAQLLISNSHNVWIKHINIQYNRFFIRDKMRSNLKFHLALLLF